ncbi:MAG TPA: cytochrome b/b6 domain-containing protein [Allosphingosinicella sp.]|nr:cytochrome b/b6 domain-containing protein [Allosphingosinicella sp.]
MSHIRVWDLPTRAFHWLIVLLMPALWWTGEEHMDELHLLLGEVALGLILFRIVWGLIGGSTARFAGFVKGPGAILAYLRGERPAGVGHNPLGALSVLALLVLLATVTGLGLFATDEDGLAPGPLSHLVTFDSARILAERHEQLFWILVGFIGLHVAAILFYLLVRHDNLVTPMVTGARAGRGGEEAMTAAPAWRFFIAAGAAVALTWAIVRGV